MRKKIILLIDVLGSGGAQRQLCLLALLLKDNGYDLQIVVYHPGNFYNDLLSIDKCIPITQIEWGSSFELIYRFSRLVRASKADVVISFMESPSRLAVLATLFQNNVKLIVSERDCESDQVDVRLKFRMFLYRRTYKIVSNSYAQNQIIKDNFKKLQSKLGVIGNMVDLNKFENINPLPYDNSGDLKFVVLARICPQKDVLTFVRAVHILVNQRPDLNISFDWYGRLDDDQYMNEVCSTMRALSVDHIINFHLPTTDVGNVFSTCHALLLPSIHEGCPNVVCEAMASGVPVIASEVGDVNYLLDSACGITFLPANAESMCAAINSFINLSSPDRRQLGIAGRDRANQIMNKNSFIKKWIDVIEG